MSFDVILVQMAARNHVIFLWVDNVPQGDRTSYFLSATPPPKEFDLGGWR